LAWSTLEVRWFCPGSLAESGSAVELWFRARPVPRGGQEAAPLAWEPAPPAWRRDRYLIIPGHDDMGIKWREDRLEIKGREAALGPRAFVAGIEGRCERWLKWSYAGEPVAERLRGVFESGAASNIVTVAKRRLQRRLRLDSAGGMVEVGPDAGRERGLNVELAEICVPGRPGSHSGPHWSLAFEAFPSDPWVAARFAAAVARFLEDCPARPLSADQSMSYPRWLLELDQRDRSHG
jgi:hypothetical protein